MRCLHLLSQTLDFSRAELKSKRLKPSTSVKTGNITLKTRLRNLPIRPCSAPIAVLATLNDRFRHCLSMTKMLNSENVLAQSGLSDSAATNLTADRILYQHAVSQCQEAALDELLGSPGGCVQVSTSRTLCEAVFSGKFKLT